MPIIIATAVLHNVLQTKGEAIPIDDLDIELPAQWDELIERGRIRQQRLQNTTPGNNNRRDLNPVRRALINNYFHSLQLNGDDE